MPDEPMMRRSPLLRIHACILRMMTALWQSVASPRPELPMRTCEDSFTLTVPCKGDAFSFKVVVSEIWTCRGELSALETAVDTHKSAFNKSVERLLRDISRHHPLDATEEFERAAIASFSRPLGFSDDPALSCTCSVTAEPDAGLCDTLRDAEITRLRNDADRREVERQVDHLEQMRDRWLTFLKKADKDPLGSLAVQLAGDEKVAEAILKHASERERAADELRKLCDTTSQAYRDKDLFDFATSMDSPLSRLLRHVDGMPGTRGEEADATNGAHPPTEAAPT